MKLIYAAALLLNVAFASVTVVDGKKIVLTGSSCDDLLYQAEAILSWSNKLGENLDADLPECFTSESGSNVVDVYGISPKMVQAYQGVKPEYSGPNCWNRSLAFAKILPSLSYTTPEEMTLWMESPLCQERLPGEEAMPGDILVVRKPYGVNVEVHGFTYLTDDLTFSKNGYSKASAFEYQSLSKVLGIYRVSSECSRVFGKPSGDHPCARKSYVNYFNCMSVDEYFSNSNIEVSAENMAIYERLIEIDREVFSYLFNEYKKVDKEALRVLNSELRQGIDIAKAYLKDAAIDGDTALFWNALMRRAEALVVQISLIK